MKSLLLLASFALLAVPRVALSQAAPLRTMSSDILVTADARPVDAESLSVSATVITREEIDRRKASSVLDLLRTVPGLDVRAVGRTGRRDIALPARHVEHADPRARGRREDQ
jgi:outer membrane cobalamin receptor